MLPIEATGRSTLGDGIARTQGGGARFGDRDGFGNVGLERGFITIFGRRRGAPLHGEALGDSPETRGENHAKKGSNGSAES